MISFAKAEGILRNVGDNLTLRLAGSASIDTVRQAKDSLGWPMLFLSRGGVETAGSAVIAIRIKGVDAVSKDVLGNALTAYSPHALEFAYELTAANNPIPIDADIFRACYEAMKTGVKFQLKELANATAVTAANMDAAAVAVELDDLYWPNKGV